MPGSNFLFLIAVVCKSLSLLMLLGMSSGMKFVYCAYSVQAVNSIKWYFNCCHYFMHAWTHMDCWIKMYLLHFSEYIFLSVYVFQNELGYHTLDEKVFNFTTDFLSVLATRHMDTSVTSLYNSQTSFTLPRHMFASSHGNSSEECIEAHMLTFRKDPFAFGKNQVCIKNVFLAHANRKC